MQIPYLNDVLIVLLPALAVVWTFVHHRRVTHGNAPAFRPLRGIVDFQYRTDDAVETGRPIHVATGSNERGAAGASADTIASLLVAQRVAELTAQQGGMTAVTNGDALAHVATRGTVHRTYRQGGVISEYRGHEPHLVAHQSPVAYAMGVAQQRAADLPDAGVIVGTYGSEALLLGAEGLDGRYPQLAGATSLAALPALTLSTDATLVGEELYAAEAYLSDEVAPKARLLTQDALRWTVVALLVVGVVYQLVNTLLSVGLPSL